MAYFTSVDGGGFDYGFLKVCGWLAQQENGLFGRFVFDFSPFSTCLFHGVLVLVVLLFRVKA